jgi:hypothetical protein
MYCASMLFFFLAPFFLPFFRFDFGSVQRREHKMVVQKLRRVCHFVVSCNAALFLFFFSRLLMFFICSFPYLQSY